MEKYISITPIQRSHDVDDMIVDDERLGWEMGDENHEMGNRSRENNN